MDVIEKFIGDAFTLKKVHELVGDVHYWIKPVIMCFIYREKMCLNHEGVVVQLFDFRSISVF